MEGVTVGQVLVGDLQRMKAAGEPITSLGVFDAQTARLADALGMDMLMVGDAGGICLLGHQSMTDISITDMLVLTAAVARGTERALVVADMPYMTYHISAEDGVRNAARFIVESRARAVKCEGDRSIAASRVAPIVRAGIPVVAHIGVQGFRIPAYGARVEGKTAQRARELIADAEAMVEAGCFAVLCELMTPEVVGYLTETLPVPVLSLGSGTNADGVYLISSDMLGMCGGRAPRSAKRYVNLSEVITRAFQEYMEDVREHRYPGPEHSTSMSPAEAAALRESLEHEQAPGDGRG
jgi:3-methyl-2-oxobutanoate hydroxymethyltransferase